MKNTSIANQRLLNLHISGGKPDKPGQVVKSLGALQAQDYHQSVWAIGLRMPAATLADIERAIEEREILRTWPMRGTIHWVTPEDAAWMLKLSEPRMLAGAKRRREQLELDEAILERCGMLLYDALHGNQRLARSAIMQLLEDAGISTNAQRGYHILWYLAQTGLICIGPMQNKEQSFALLEDWAPNPRKLSREEGLAELAGTYFASHGPATLHDFAWWAGLTIAEAKQGIEAARPKLMKETTGGAECWSSPNSRGLPAAEESDVYLLPGFDEYLLGYKDRSAVLMQEYAPRIVPGQNGVFMPCIVVSGQIVGTWKRTLKKKTMEMTLIPFEPLGNVQDEVLAAAKRYSEFMGLQLVSAEFQLDH
ncbi:winged helix DNA-binding domain-containing protein [Paenibacillus eucommiae]|uniref:Winged helix DNA-binding domain-containing protein n=1 Tax=Paenibacillus eucommiae TaxID=1355755 RepID=A0ABS4J7F0_9BACL|nr:winged helix DNA-binding domain-containing protein [Paenibacillus eucommiae]MBP1995768.1 hypothetical protein [Paenibacillus eucommiae]